MPPPVSVLQEIIDYDLTVLGALVGETPGVNYNIGLVTLTTQPANLRQVSAANTPWLLVTDGDGDEEFQPSSAVRESSDIIYMGYVMRDEERFPGMSAPQIRRGLMCDIMYLIDNNVDRGERVSDRDRTRVIHDDQLGEWSIFYITETVYYHRSII